MIPRHWYQFADDAAVVTGLEHENQVLLNTKNIYNFCIRYLNNTIANSTNLHKWGKAPSPLCSGCNKPQTLGHVVAGCT